MVLHSNTRPKYLLLKILNFTTSCVVSYLFEKLQEKHAVLAKRTSFRHLGAHALTPSQCPFPSAPFPSTCLLARRAEGTSQEPQLAILANKGGYHSFGVCSLAEIEYTPLQRVVPTPQQPRKEVSVQRLLLHLHVSWSNSEA